MQKNSRGLFINNIKAKDSIYESGYMVYQCIKDSDFYTLDYQEIDINCRHIQLGYDFYFFNYHPVTMGWLDTRTLKKDLGFVMTMVLEVAPNDIFVMCPKNDFDVYCAIDPSFKSQVPNVISFPRPLENIDYNLNNVNHEIPVIGTFGFATRGKGFQHVVDAVNKEFNLAIIKINIPFGDFVPESEKYAKYLGDLCKSKAKSGIKVEVTHDFMSKEELINWCNRNTLNCFLYDRDMPGLSATTDQAIVSERPLSVSRNTTFRHIIEYLIPYPEFSLKDSINKSVPLVKKMKEEWNADNFKKIFEKSILDFKQKFRSNESLIQHELPIIKKNFNYFLQKRLKKYFNFIHNFSLKTLLNLIHSNEII